MFSRIQFLQVWLPVLPCGQSRYVFNDVEALECLGSGHRHILKILQLWRLEARATITPKLKSQLGPVLVRLQ